MTEPRIYIGTPLDGAYGPGWINLDGKDYEDVWNIINRWRDENDIHLEEFLVTDHEGFEPVSASRLGMEVLVKIANAREEIEDDRGETAADGFLHYIGGVLGTTYFGEYMNGGDAHDLVRKFEEAWYGHYESVKEFGYQHFESFNEVSQTMKNYFDFKAYGQDTLDGSYYSSEGDDGVYVYYIV